MALVCLPSSNISEPKIKLLTNYLSEMKGKICGENLCSHGAFMHTGACSLCVDGSELDRCPVHGAGNWLPHTTGGRAP